MNDKSDKLFEKFGKIVHKNETIFREGDFGDQMYIVQEGEIEIRKKAKDSYKVLDTLNDGDFFGEMAIIDKSPRSASAVALEDSRLLVVTERSFDFMLDNNINFTKKLVGELVEKIRNSNKLIYELLTKNKRHQVFSSLIRFSRIHWNPSENGNMVELNPYIEWAIKSIGIEKQKIIDTLNDLIKDKTIVFGKVETKNFIILPTSELKE